MFNAIYTETGALYIEDANGNRAIIRDGKYDGWYDHNLSEVLE